MCGGGGDQTVTQKTELDPALQRLLYGGSIANPRGGFGGGSDGGVSTPVNPGDYGDYGADRGVGEPMNAFGDDYFGDSSSVGDVSGGSTSEDSGLGNYGGTNGFGGGVYADGGLVQEYNMGGQVQPQGLAALNQGQMPMVGGQLPNLSDPMTAATLAMAVRQPEMQYGSIMAQPDPMMMQPQQPGPMMMQPQQPDPMMMQPQQRYVEGGYVEGPGSGRSDDIEAQIYQDGVPVQEARLSDGEFVMTERAVRGAGDGDSEEGAAKMYRMMQEFERGGYV